MKALKYRFEICKDPALNITRKGSKLETGKEGRGFFCDHFHAILRVIFVLRSNKKEETQLSGIYSHVESYNEIAITIFARD